MSTTKRPSFTKVITPVGTLVYPKLNTPDTKFKADGEYQGKIRLSAEDSEKVIALYEKELKAYWPIAKAELEQKVKDATTGPAKAKAKKALEEMKEADRPFKPAYDDDGNETGEYEFNFKSPASFLKDKGKTTEKKVPIKLDFFDAKGKPLKVVPEIWGGTSACVAGELRPFSMPIGVGLSLRLKAVQIIELQSAGGARNAGSYGFGAQDGGYEGNDEDAPEGGFSDHSDGDKAEGDGAEPEDF